MKKYIVTLSLLSLFAFMPSAQNYAVAESYAEAKMSSKERLFDAVKRMNFGDLTEALKNGHANPNAQNQNGDTAMHMLVQHEDLSLKFVRELIKYGARLDIENKNGQSPIDIATAIHGLSRAITLLALYGERDRSSVENRRNLCQYVEGG